jgi:hypothetical protein
MSPKGIRQIDDLGPYEYLDKERTIRYYARDQSLACLHSDMPSSLCVQCIKRMVSNSDGSELQERLEELKKR